VQGKSFPKAQLHGQVQSLSSYIYNKIFIMKQHIKLNFTDFWPGFDSFDNYFYNLLKEHYNIEISDEPDFLICSCFGEEYKKFNCIRIFYTGEAFHRGKRVKLDFDLYDYTFSFDYIASPDNYRLPIYAWYFSYELERAPDVDFNKLLSEKTGFCNFVYSNAKAKERVQFFHKLSKYKKVDSGGRCLNNIGESVVDKLKFIKKYKFTIAFENCSHPGYTTEKITEPFFTHSLPIYWGNPLVHRDFNAESFLNAHEFESEEALIERIIELDNNDELYLSYLRKPCFYGNKVNQFIRHENVLDQFSYIFNYAKAPVAKARKKRLFF
jgi:alpha(1,3/1,4) fucosyltransferase